MQDPSIGSGSESTEKVAMQSQVLTTVSVLTQYNDNTRSGTNLNEAILTPNVVQAGGTEG